MHFIRLLRVFVFVNWSSVIAPSLKRSRTDINNAKKSYIGKFEICMSAALDRVHICGCVLCHAYVCMCVSLLCISKCAYQILQGMKNAEMMMHDPDARWVKLVQSRSMEFGSACV